MIETSIRSISIGALIMFVLILLIGFIYRGNKIEDLESSMNIKNFALSVANANIVDLNNTLRDQNEKIRNLKVDIKERQEEIKNQKPKIIEKWRTKTNTVYIKNSTCEQKLEQLDQLDKEFFDARKNK